MAERDTDIVLKIDFDDKKVNREIEKIESNIEKLEKQYEKQESKIRDIQQEYDMFNRSLQRGIENWGEKDVNVIKVKNRVVELNDELEKEKQKLEEINSKLKEKKALLERLKTDPGSFFPSEETIGSKGYKKDVDDIQTKVSSIIETTPKMINPLKRMGGILSGISNTFSKIYKRVIGLAGRVFIFSVITMGLRHVREWLNNVIQGNSQLSSTLSTVKFNLQTAFMPIFQTVLPALQTLLTFLAKASSYFSTFIHTILGKDINSSKQAVKSLNNQSKAMKRLGNETKKTNKQLANFDELNLLTKEKNQKLSNTNKPPPQVIEFDTSRAEIFAKQFEKSMEPISKAFDRLKEKLSPFKGDLFSGLRWSYNNVLKPISKWALETLFPKTIDLIGTSLYSLGTTVDTVKPSLKSFFEQFLKPVGEWTGEKTIRGIEEVTKSFDEFSVFIKENSDDINYALQGVAEVFGWTWEKTLKHALNKSLTFCKEMYEGGKKTMGEMFKEYFKSIGGATDIIMGTVKKDSNRILKGLKTFLINASKLFVKAMTIISMLQTPGGLTGAAYGWAAKKGIEHWLKSRTPHLAQGGVIPPNREFLAVLGDQKSGTNIEAPLETIKQALSEVMMERQGNVSGDITFVAELDGRAIFKETVRQDEIYKKQRGRSAFSY